MNSIRKIIRRAKARDPLSFPASKAGSRATEKDREAGIRELQVVIDDLDAVRRDYEKVRKDYLQNT